MRFFMVAVLAGISCGFWSGSKAAAQSILFQRHQLDNIFRSEGVAVGDFNRDGKKDIAAGTVWYAAPDWKMHSIDGEIPAYDPKGYSHSFINAAQDVNADGWTDLMVVDFPGTPTWWFENPKGQERPWVRHELTPVSNNESPQFLDADGDGQREWLMGVAASSEQADGADRQVAFLRPQSDPYLPWKIDPISAPGQPGALRYDHGIGLGDVNGDGLSDVVVSQGWYEHPASGENPSHWSFHGVTFGGPCSHMYVFDIDGDGDSDVLNSSAHSFGIWWHEQTEPDQWVTHEIDMSVSQTHALCLADINGDGLLDFVTGKRWWAHGGNDPGADQPALFLWYEARRENGRATWVAHQFDDNSGPGTQFEVADIDDDGLLDVIASNKKGVHLFRQVRSGE